MAIEYNQDKVIKDIGIKTSENSQEFLEIGADAKNVFIQNAEHTQYGDADGVVDLQTKLDNFNKSVRNIGSGVATEVYATAFGRLTQANGQGSHAEGCQTIASGVESHAEGYLTSAEGEHAHSEGEETLASGKNSHAEGYLTTASGERAHAEGKSTSAIGADSHAEGRDTWARGVGSHAEGTESQVLENCGSAHAEGYKTMAKNTCAHAEGHTTTASGDSSHAEGYATLAQGGYSHAEGQDTQAIGDASHAEGYDTYADGVKGAHAEGSETKATGLGAHAEGCKTHADDYASHAEGWGTHAYGYGCHSEGQNTEAIGFAVHAEGVNSVAKSTGSHAEGYNTLAEGAYSHAEGFNTQALGANSHVEGSSNIGLESTKNSHIEGFDNRLVSGEGCHIEGYGNQDWTLQNIETSFYKMSENSIYLDYDLIKLTGPEEINVKFDGRVYAYSYSYLPTGNLELPYPSTGEDDVQYYRGSLWAGRNTTIYEQHNIILKQVYKNEQYYNNLLCIEELPELAAALLKNLIFDERGILHSQQISGVLSNGAHVQGRYGVLQENLAHIVGGGTALSDRRNIHTIDWDGNALFTGDIDFYYTISDDQNLNKIISLSEKILELETRLKTLESK